MKIEMLYPEVCNLFGDISNIKYLKKCLPDAEIIKTEINSEPAFVTQDVDMIYMGPMPENIQEVAIRKLRPYKERIEELIKKNVVFLVTGNAFGTYLIGPILILNPLFTKKLIQMLGVKEPTIAFEKETMAAYEQRLEEFKR